MQKDSTNHVGFSYNNGEIKAIVKDSSAARYERERERERERGGGRENVCVCVLRLLFLDSYVAKMIQLNFPYF